MGLPIRSRREPSRPPHVLNGTIIAARTAAANAREADLDFLDFLPSKEAAEMAETLEVAAGERSRLARALRARLREGGD